MSTTRVVIRPGDKPSRKAIKEVKEATKREPVFDDESPKFTKEELRAMAEKALKR